MQVRGVKLEEKTQATVEDTVHRRIIKVKRSNPQPHQQ
jgi:hypothetical protein